MQAFNHQSARYATYHIENASSNFIGLKLTGWNDPVWSDLALFALPGSGGSDFPTLSINALAATSTIAVVAQFADDFKYWSCSGTQANCNDATEFGDAVVPLTVGKHLDPKVLAVPRGGVTDVFVFYEANTPYGTTVGVASNCGDLGIWAEGLLPLPFGAAVNAKVKFGTGPSSSNRVIFWDGTSFFVAIHVTNPDYPTLYDLAYYTATPGQFCP